MWGAKRKPAIGSGRHTKGLVNKGDLARRPRIDQERGNLKPNRDLRKEWLTELSVAKGSC